MDSNQGQTPSSGSGKQPQEEVRDELQAMGRAAADLLEHLVRVPAALAQIPLQYLPEDTATHARNAANEGFKAVRTLMDSISSQVDQIIAEQSKRSSMHTGTGPSTGAGSDAPSGETPHTTGSNGNGSTGPEATRRLDDEGPSV